MEKSGKFDVLSPVKLREKRRERPVTLAFLCNDVNRNMSTNEGKHNPRKRQCKSYGMGDIADKTVHETEIIFMIG